MNTLIRMMGAMARVNSHPRWLRCSAFNGESRVKVNPEEWDHADVHRALLDEFGKTAKIRSWFVTSGDTQVMVFSVRVEVD